MPTWHDLNAAHLGPGDADPCPYPCHRYRRWNTGPKTQELCARTSTIVIHEEEPPPQRWIPIGADAPAFQPRQLADRFRDLLLAGILELYRVGLLDLDSVQSMRGIESEGSWPGAASPPGRASLGGRSKITPEHLQGKDSACRYVSGYMTGTAINNARMRADDGTNVTIDVWDYRTDTWTTETMLGAEFVRRFMLHIVPPTIHRVRYAGCFNARSRKTRLDSIRAMICEHNLSTASIRQTQGNDHGGWLSVKQRPRTRKLIA